MSRGVIENWSELERAFILSPYDDLQTFLESIGKHKKLQQSKHANGMAERKRQLIQRLRESLVEGEIKANLQRLEKVRSETIDNFVKASDYLRHAAMVRLTIDNQETNKKPNETAEQWQQRVMLKMADNKSGLLRPDQIAYLGAALEKAQDIVWRAAAMDGYNPEREAEMERLKLTAKKMEVEIIKTSNAPNIEDLPHAEEIQPEEAT